MPAKPNAIFKKRFNDLLEAMQIHRSSQFAADALHDVLKPVRKVGANFLTQQEVARWRGGMVPNRKILSALAAYFSVSSEYLIGATDVAETDLGKALVDYVARQLEADPVFTPVFNLSTGKASGRGARRTSYRADSVRLLRFVVSAVRASLEADRDVLQSEGSTRFLQWELADARDALKQAGAREAAAQARRAGKRIDAMLAQHLGPKLLDLFDADASAPLRAFRLEVVPKSP